MDETQLVKCLWDFCPQAGTGAPALGEAKSDLSQVGPLPERQRHSADLPLNHCLPSPGSICSEKYLTTGQIQLT